MGAGKSTVGRAVAARRGVPFVDLDDAVGQVAGVPVPTMIRERGLAAFRRLEAAVLSGWIDGRPVSGTAPLPRDAVVALGGGTLPAAPGLRRRLVLAGDAVVVTLAGDVDTLLGRLAGSAGALADRPLLADAPDPRRALRDILETRRAAYAECHGVVASDPPVEQVVDGVLGLVGEQAGSVVVPLGEATYRVEIGEGVRHRLTSRLGPGRPVVAVTDEHVAAAWPGVPDDLLDDAAEGALRRIVLPPGEATKDLTHLARIWDQAIAAGAHRGSPFVAIGGGVVGDVTGFAAATYLRGVPWVQLPTSLLAMVDSSVGGKTAIDRAGGKNLVGAFHQPRAVLVDPVFLGTLPATERVAGLAEVAKAAWLAGEEDVAFLEVHGPALGRGDAAPGVVAEVIRRAVRLKARLVAEDERERGDRRALLNLGHTFGHALEGTGGTGGLSHGAAVALGMVVAFRVAAGLGVGGPELEARMARLLRALGHGPGLDQLEERLRAPGVLDRLALDKKRTAPDRVRFVVPGAPGEAGLEDVGLDRLRRWAGG